jgi:hypothetical protein
MDIFYRDTPHPRFGNRYFGLLIDLHGSIVITGADNIEGQYVHTITDDEGREHYSRHRHDFVDLPNGLFIDGGRQYVRTNPNTNIKTYVVTDGQIVEAEQ